MSELLNGWKRTCYCTELSKENAGQEVVLMGWVNVYRNLGSLIFIQLRDRSGLIQIVFDKNALSEADYEKAASLRTEYVLAVKGVVSERTGNMVNPNMKTGEIEILVREFKMLSASETTPFEIDDDCNANEALRLRYRYLDLRRPVMQRNLIMRHEIAHIARNYFAENGFLEIETPILTKSTPEGARDYLVPSRVHPGSFYALPQSPQLFKQLLMLSGFDRYMQIARCFRDEDLRADRQPDFTQIDLEMSFVEEDDVMEVNERFLKRLFKEMLNYDVQLPLPRLPYSEAMGRYGSDKPDTRFGMELCELTDLLKDSEFTVFRSVIESKGSIECIVAKGAADTLSRKDIDALTEFVKGYNAKGLMWISSKDDGIHSPALKHMTETELQSVLSRAGIEKHDIAFIVADKISVVKAALGALRCHLANKLGLIRPGQYNLLWVTDFPLLEYSEEEGRYVAMHHPFTSPKDEDLDKLESDPGEVRAKAYDIILNGVELGGGSIRIHSQELQKRMFKALGFTEEQAQERFGFLLNAFKYGAPPHGGMAYGLDRLAMLICGTDSIRDVIAFPKVQNASCPLTGAPDTVDAKQLKELHIACTDE